jgi:hypothetical protein
MRQLDQNAAVSEHEIELSHQSRRRFGQRLLVGLPLLGAALAAQQAGVAEAGSATSPWTMEGNSNVDSNDAIGSKNNIALRFITNNSERLRIAANGNIGAGVANPTARMQIVSGQQVAFRAETSSAVNGVRAVLGVLTAPGVPADAAAVKGVVEGGAQTDFTSYAVWGEHRGAYGVGVYGECANGGTGVKGGGVVGVEGVGEIGVSGRGLTGVRGEGYYGVRAITFEPDGIAVLGITDVAPGKAIAILGRARGQGHVAGRFEGKVEIVGTLSKSAGSFKIDHPLDPQNKYLSHSFVESPDMMNVYNGNVVLDGQGKAMVTLPAYFEALNGDFRYQLTAIGAAAPNLHVAQEISGNSFRIAGGTPGLKVSWQVTGIRQDAYAKANPIVVEEDKLAEERGSYLQPEAHGQPTEKGIMQARAQRIEQARAARPQTKP